MIRMETETGWWLITHPEHARLAAGFAEHWGNDLFARPQPRVHVLTGIATHDDGWAVRDSAPRITRQGWPSAFSSELVGKYSAFEEINLVDYLAVRERAVRLVAESDSYAALLVSMHTYNLLTERADRSSIAPEQLPLLDEFLAGQKGLQESLYASILEKSGLSFDETSRVRIEDNFHLLQAVDNLSLLGCVDYDQPATLLRPLRLRDGGAEPVTVESLGERYFSLSPYPLDVSPLKAEFPARHVRGKKFESAAELQQQYRAAAVTMLDVTVTAHSQS